MTARAVGQSAFVGRHTGAIEVVPVARLPYAARHRGELPWEAIINPPTAPTRRAWLTATTHRIHHFFDRVSLALNVVLRTGLAEPTSAAAMTKGHPGGCPFSTSRQGKPRAARRVP